jgi:alkylation response protein AidB-like acyl-CoA dehydrogenase
MGIGIDPAYGGSGGGATETVIAVEEVCRAYAGIGTILAVQIGLYGPVIERFGSQAQKKAFLTPLNEGKLVGAFGLTEPNAGSNAAALESTAARTGDVYHLSGSKTFISCADGASHFIIAATTDKRKGGKGIAIFVVPRNAKGFTIKKQVGKIGIIASTTCDLFFDNVEVPVANRIGEEDQGYKNLLQVLEVSRMSVAAQATGIAQSALDASVAWTQQRKSFGAPLVQHQGIQFMLAEMATRVEAARLLTYQAAALRDAGKPFSKESSMAKLFAAEAAMSVATDAVQVHGGYGYFKGSIVERCFRDAKITAIYEGTSEVQKMLIAKRLIEGNR